MSTATSATLWVVKLPVEEPPNCAQPSFHFREQNHEAGASYRAVAHIESDVPPPSTKRLEMRMAAIYCWRGQRWPTEDEPSLTSKKRRFQVGKMEDVCAEEPY
jgi:hypothetical protein